MSRGKKLTESERRQIAKRYHAWLQNRPKRICAEHGISEGTMHKYAREFRA